MTKAITPTLIETILNGANIGREPDVWETVEIGALREDLVELRTIDAAIVEAARELSADGGK